MTATLSTPSAMDAALRASVDAACARVAPAWPLDRLIAVNPYWGWVQRPMAEVAHTLDALAPAPMLMPRDWYLQRWADGHVTDEWVRRALDRMASTLTVDEVRAALAKPAPSRDRHPLVSDLREALRPETPHLTWGEAILQQIGRACEAYFDAGQAAWAPDRSRGLYTLWLELARVDASPGLLIGARGLAAAIRELPERPEALIADALETLAVPKAAREDYLTALLLSVSGWASACAFRRWEARRAEDDDTSLVDLLAIRLAWELVLYRTADGTDLPSRWRRARLDWQQTSQAPAESAPEWIVQRAMELRFHDRLADALVWHPTVQRTLSGAAAPGTTHAQAVFCIDVRSEVYRRHLEEADSGIRTLGFAGFFGLPIAYRPLVGADRPQLPGLLGPSLLVEDVGAEREAAAAREVLQRRDAETWRRFLGGAPSGFIGVEATGLTAALAMLKASFAPTPRAGDPLRAGLDRPTTDGNTATDARDVVTLTDATEPQLVRHVDGHPLGLDERRALARGVLRAMGLSDGFAPVVALIGHAAHVTNNPQAAGLACGACGGQGGEVNARALAALLNDAELRAALAADGIEIPADTAFVGGLHDTTTDAITLYPSATVRRTHGDALDVLERSFARATRRTRVERQPGLGLSQDAPEALAEALAARAGDWSEVRPEWGLAGNAAFIAAPRERTRALDLKGRVFLHEYDPARDPGFGVLETILTAPVVVAHWINLQYWASTVDPERFGSGDKTLHNVVGGTVGVYEGAGGDLRIGLARQSVHDGSEWRHEPIRLGVFLEAPAPAIDAVLAKHDTVRALVEGEWLFLHRIDAEAGKVYRRQADGWVPVR